MASPVLAQNGDDLMSRLTKASSETATQNNKVGSSDGTDLMSRLQAATANSPVTMVGPRGTKVTAAPQDVPAYRKSNFAVTADNPGVVKAVNYRTGNVNYILPQEVETFHNAGHAIVQSDGSIRYPIIRDSNGVIGQDPLEEQKAHQRVYQALNAEEQGRNRSFELKEFGKAGIKATVATGLGVTGAGALSSAMEAGGTALAESEAYQLFSSSPKLYAEYLTRQGMKGVVEYATKHKIATALVLDQMAKVMGIQKSTLLHKLLTAGGEAMTE